MSSLFTSPQQWLWELAHSEPEAPTSNRILWTENDNNLAMQAHDLIVNQQAECEELRKQLDTAKRSVTALENERTANKAELADAWRIQRETKQKLSKLHSEALDCTVVHQAIGCAEFTLDCIDSIGNPDNYVIIQIMREVLRGLRRLLQPYNNSDIPF